MLQHILEGIEVFCAVAAFIFAIIAYFDARHAINGIRNNKAKFVEFLDFYNTRHQEIRELNFTLRKEFLDHVKLYNSRTEELRTLIIKTTNNVIDNVHSGHTNALSLEAMDAPVIENVEGNILLKKEG